METDEYENWVGKSKTATDIIAQKQIDLLTATLADAARPKIPQIKNALPYGWHWLFFHEPITQSQLGRDGHEKLGAFLPELPLKRRMWASGSLTFHASPVIGAAATKKTLINSINAKTGKSGKLIFIELHHTINQGDRHLLTEIQNLVYCEEAKTQPAISVNKTATAPPGPPQSAQLVTIQPDPVLMFRYSALTFNGHRIHYDADYARDVEGYQAIVFHGPLTATLMMNFAASANPTARLATFSFRGTSAIDSAQPFQLRLQHDNSAMQLLAVKADNTLAMQAKAEFSADHAA